MSPGSDGTTTATAAALHSQSPAPGLASQRKLTTAEKEGIKEEVEAEPHKVVLRVQVGQCGACAWFTLPRCHCPSQQHSAHTAAMESRQLWLMTEPAELALCFGTALPVVTLPPQVASKALARVLTWSSNLLNAAFAAMAIVLLTSQGLITTLGGVSGAGGCVCRQPRMAGAGCPPAAMHGAGSMRRRRPRCCLPDSRSAVRRLPSHHPACRRGVCIWSAWQSGRSAWAVLLSFSSGWRHLCGPACGSDAPGKGQMPAAAGRCLHSGTLASLSCGIAHSVPVILLPNVRASWCAALPACHPAAPQLHQLLLQVGQPALLFDHSSGVSGHRRRHVGLLPGWYGRHFGAA